MMAVKRIDTTPVRTDKDVVVTIEEIRRKIQELVDELNKLSGRVTALEKA